MKRKLLAAVGLATAMLLAACSADNESNAVKEDSESPNIKELVNDYSVGNITDQKASITSHQLIITNNDETQEFYDLPEDEFFVSIAPYVNETHP